MAILGMILEPEDAHYNAGTQAEATGSFWTDSTRGLIRRAFRSYNASDAKCLIRHFPTTKTTACLCGKFSWNPYGIEDHPTPFIGFASGNLPIIAACISYDSENSVNRMQVKKWNTSTESWDTLATSSETLSFSSFRIDMLLENHGESSRVRVWIRYCSYNVLYTGAHVLLIDEEVDTRVTGHSIDGMFIAPSYTYDWAEWGSLLGADEATHRYEVLPHDPTDDGDTNTLSAGTFEDVDEATASIVDTAESDTAGQKLLVKGRSLPTGVTGAVAVQVSALMSAGTSGPDGAYLGVKNGSTEDFDDSLHELSGAWSNESRLINCNLSVSETNNLQYGFVSADVP